MATTTESVDSITGEVESSSTTGSALMYSDTVDLINSSNQSIIKIGQSAKKYMELYENFITDNLIDTDILKKLMKEKIIGAINDD